MIYLTKQWIEAAKICNEQCVQNLIRGIKHKSRNFYGTPQ